MSQTAETNPTAPTGGLPIIALVVQGAPELDEAHTDVHHHALEHFLAGLPDALAARPARVELHTPQRRVALAWSGAPRDEPLDHDVDQGLTLDGIDEALREAGAELRDALELDTIGTWLELHDTGFDLGWSSDDTLSGPTLLSTLSEHDDFDLLAGWMVEYERESVTALRASVAAPGWRLDVPLFGRPERSLKAVADLLDDLDQLLPEGLRQALLEPRPRDPLAMRLALTPDGIAALGVVLPRPTLEHALLLHTLLDIEPTEALALGGELAGTPESLTVWWTVEGLALETTFVVEMTTI